MATVDILLPAFGITWAQDGTVSAIDENQWRAGWAYIGATPPSVEQFNKVHQIQDQKANWLYGQVLSIVTGASGVTSVGNPDSLRDAVITYIKSRGVEFNNWVSITANITLNATHIGRGLQVVSAGAITIILPLANSVRNGATLNLKNTGVGTATLQRAGSDTLYFGVSTPIAPQVGPGDDIMLVSNGVDAWLAMSGSAQTRYSAGFLSLGAAAGYQRLPSGIIVQWGSISNAAGASKTEVFPMNFPTAVFSVVATGRTATGNLQAYAVVNSQNTVNFTWSGFSGNGGTAPVLTAAAGGVLGSYIAIGH